MYVLDTEMKIYSAVDRKVALEKVLEKLGVAGSTNIKLSCGTNEDKINDSIFVYDNNFRKLSSINIKFENNLNLYHKYLILYNKTNGKIALLYNTHFYMAMKRCQDPLTSIPVYNIEAECMFKINDLWEAIRLIECSTIDVGVEDILKDMYFDMNPLFKPVAQEPKCKKTSKTKK